MVDKDEYPRTAAIEEHCWHILASLWSVPDVNGLDRHVDHRIIGGVHARRPRVQAALAARPPGRRQVDREAQPDHELRRAGVLGEVLQLLRGRAALRSGHRRAPHARRQPAGAVRRREHHRRGRHHGRHLHRHVRAGEGDRGRARRPAGEDRVRRADPCRRGIRGHDRAVPAARDRVGLPARAGALDQHLGPQVRAGLPRRRLGRLAQRSPRCPTSSSSASATSAATCRPWP